MSRRIEIVEVGPRDGLQNEARTLCVAERMALIARLEAAGARRIEAVSFVNPRRVPQMAGAEEIMAALPRSPGRSRIGLVLNMRRWERCVAAGCEEANVVVCATDRFGVRNQGAGTSEQLETALAVAGRWGGEGPHVSATVSVAFGGVGGCPFAPNATGNIATEDLVYMPERGGFETGFDLAALIAAADALGERLGRPTPSSLSRAGGFPAVRS